MGGVIVVGFVAAYLGIGVVVSRFLMKPWVTKEFNEYDVMAACLVGLFWPIAVVAAVAYLLGRLSGGKVDDNTNGTREE